MTTPKPVWPLVTAVAMLLLLTLQPTWAGDSVDDSKQKVSAKKAVVASDDGRCSDIGKQVLLDGGNAIDAAVATTLCLGVVGAGSSGIGGGAFMMIRLANGTVKCLDMREQAPAKTYEEMYNDNPDAKIRGPLSIAVPGELAGLHTAWKLYGVLPWPRLVQPAIDLAKNGYELSKYLHSQCQVNTTAIFSDPGLCSVYTGHTWMCGVFLLNRLNRLAEPGETIKNSKLAETLNTIAHQGPSVLYRGSIGQNLVNDIQKAGGIMTTDDLAAYEVKVRDPIVVDVWSKLSNGSDGGLKVITMPPPSAGGACLIFLLNLLQHFGIPDGISGPLGRHWFIEALKHAFGLRMNLGDADFFPDVKKVVESMIDPQFAEAIYRNISNYHTFNESILYGGKYDPIPDDGTSHLSIVDEQRNAVALTSSVNWHFGSTFLSTSTGILLNNEMDDFSTPYGPYSHPAPANFIVSKKRPLSSMSPTIVLRDGQLQAVMGASGGPFIIVTLARVFLNHFGLNMDPYSSVIGPRCYHKLYPNVVYYENYTTVTGNHIEISDEVIQYLEDKGHYLQEWQGEGAICQMIVHEIDKTGNLVGVSDPRKGGYPSGY